MMPIRLREISLARSSAPRHPERFRFGRYTGSGRIAVFEQPPPPWTMTSPIAEGDAERLRSAGAVIESIHAGAATRISWPDEANLLDFMRFDVLMHEIGHHCIQQYTGKRSALVLRTRDHERAAELFAARCRLRYYEGNER